MLNILVALVTVLAVVAVRGAFKLALLPIQAIFGLFRHRPTA